MGKTGHWILDSIVSMDNTNIKTFIYKCSECGFYTTCNRIDVCHHCGAKMNNQEKGKNNMNMNMLNDTKGMRHQATELIEQAYHKGYKAGVEDGRKLYEESGIFKPRNSAAKTVYCKDCVFRNDYCKCTKLGLIHMTDKIQLQDGYVLRLNEPITMCDVMHVNNDDGCSFGKRRTYDEELTGSMSTM